MKKFLIPLIFSFFFASCQKSEMDVNKPEPRDGVSFTTTITRIANNQFENGERIAVMAYTDAAFTEQHTTPMLGYEYNEELGVFNSDKPYTYTSAAPSLAFRAIYPFDANVNATSQFSFELGTLQSEHEDYTVNDLLVAKTGFTDNELAKLTFDHKMSAVNIEITEADVDVSKAVVLMYAQMAVDCDLDADTYTATGDFKSVRTQDNGDGTFRAIIAPQVLKHGTTLIKVMYVGEDHDEEYELVLDDDIEFRSGYRRKLELEIQGEALTFQSAIEDWTYDETEEEGPTVKEPMLRHFSAKKYPATENTWAIYDETAEAKDFDGLMAALNAVAETERDITVRFVNLTALPDGVFAHYPDGDLDMSALTVAEFPVTTTFGSAIFVNCPALDTVSMPKVEDTGFGVLYGCTGLRSLTIATESTITKFGDFSDDWVVGLTSKTLEGVDLSQIDLLTSEQYVDTYVFLACPAGRYKDGGSYYEPTYDYEGVNETFKYGPFKSINGQGVPAAPSSDNLMLSDLNAYIFPAEATDNVWTIKDATASTEDFDGLRSALDVITEEGGRTISLIFPNLDVLPANSFFNELHNDDKINLDSLVSVTLTTATEVGDNAFENCRLTSFSAPMVTKVGARSFNNVSTLETLEIPALTSVGSQGFMLCEGLEALSFENLETIANKAFIYCRGLETFSAPKATVVGNEAFYGCGELTSVSLPALSDGGYGLFASCPKLSEVTIATEGELVKFGDMVNGSNTFRDVKLSELTLTISSKYVVDEVYFECQAGDYHYDGSVGGFVFDGTTQLFKFGPFGTINAVESEPAAQQLMLSDISADNIPAGDVWYIFDESASAADFAGLEAALGLSSDISVVFPNLTVLETETLDYIEHMVALYIPEVTKIETSALYYNSFETLYAPKATVIEPDAMGATNLVEFVFGVYGEVTEFGEEYDDPFDYDATYMFYPSSLSITMGTVNEPFANSYGYLSLDFSSIGGMGDFYDNTYEELAALEFVDPADLVIPDVVQNIPQN